MFYKCIQKDVTDPEPPSPVSSLYVYEESNNACNENIIQSQPCFINNTDFRLSLDKCRDSTDPDETQHEPQITTSDGELVEFDARLNTSQNSIVSSLNEQNDETPNIRISLLKDEIIQMKNSYHLNTPINDQKRSSNLHVNTDVKNYPHSKTICLSPSDCIMDMNSPSVSISEANSK